MAALKMLLYNFVSKILHSAANYSFLLKGGSIIGFFRGFQTARASFERTETAQS